MQLQILFPVKIRKHLIPFFYKEFSGMEGNYLGKQVKACKINMTSSLGFLLRTTLEKADIPIRADKYYLYISMIDQDKEAKLYGCLSGKKSWLKVPDRINERVNDIFEDYFRIAFIYFVDGMLRANKFMSENERDIVATTAITEFMVDYELDENGFELESLRRLYNRGKEEDHKISRLQVKTSNRVMNYRS